MRFFSYSTEKYKVMGARPGEERVSLAGPVWPVVFVVQTAVTERSPSFSVKSMEQWVSPTKLTRLPKALDLIEAESLTDLELNNFLWIGKTILTGMGNMTSDTLPGYAQNRGGASYFILYPEKVAALVNESYNPYNVVIHADDLDIAE